MKEEPKVWMPPLAPKYERLALELETQPNADLLVKLIEHVRDNDYPRYLLVEELRSARLGYFARKLQIGWYDVNKK